MNIQNIITFLTIVDTQSLSKASDKLFVSQSTISTRLNSLERELNVKLLERQPGIRKIELTAKGAEFIMIAKKWIALEKDTSKWVHEIPTHKLSIGSVDSINTYLLTPLYRNIINHNNIITMDITTHSSVQVYTLVESHEIDIGLASRFIKNDSVISEPIFSEDMVLISSKINSNYGDFISTNQLDIKNEIFHDWGPNFQIWHDYWWNPSDRMKIKVDTAGLISRFIEIPNSWAVVPYSIAHGFNAHNSIRISNLEIQPQKRVYYKIIHRNPQYSSVVPIKIFEKHLDEFIYNHSHLSFID